MLKNVGTHGLCVLPCRYGNDIIRCRNCTKKEGAPRKAHPLWVIIMTERLFVCTKKEGAPRKAHPLWVIIMTERLFVVFAPVYVVHIAACRQFLVERETAFQVLWRMTLDAHCQILFQQRLVVWVYAVVDDATCSLDR